MGLLINKVWYSTLVCLFFSSLASNGQTFRFKNYGPESNLPSEVVYTLAQDNSGYLWVGTTEGLSRFDGFRFYNVVFPDSSVGRYATVSIKDRKGTLWFGCNDGTIFYSAGRQLKQVSLPNSSGTLVVSIREGHDGTIYVIPQRKPLFRIDPQRPETAYPIGLDADPIMSAAALTGTGSFLLGTQENLMICEMEADSLVTRKIVEGFDFSRIMSINQTPDSSVYMIGTDGNGLYRLHMKGINNLSRYSAFPGLETLTIKSVTEDSQHNYWISTSGNGALKLQFAGGTDSLVLVRVLDISSGLPGENVMTVFQDSEENIWLGFNGNGLSMLGTDPFEFYTPGGSRYTNNIIFAGKLDNDYILGTPTGFYIYDLESGSSKSFIPLAKQIGRNEISSYFIDGENNIWIGTRGSGLFLRNKAGVIKLFYRSGDTGSDYISSVKISGDNIWLATINGVHQVSRKSGELKNSYDTNNGLPGKAVNQILTGDDGSAFLATESDRLYRIDPDSGIIVSDAVMYGTLLNKMLALTRDGNGIIWTATLGNGVFECFSDSVRSLNTANGLLSNYTYSVLADRANNIWVGHERGISRYNPETGITRTFSTDFAKGGQCNSEGMFESPDSKILIGTTEGLIVYDKSKDRITRLAPFNNINSITINEVEYPYQPSFSLPYKKRYMVRINFTGINLSNPEKVYYSTFMENYDNEWTPVSPVREVSYSLRDGKYKFNLVSVNDDGLSQENPLSFEINIKRPVWRTWWFILSLFGIATGIVVLIIRQREKAQKKVQEYLEKELDARTSVVRKQKAEIELQNLEITDSINYAKRIQSSILPDRKRLKEHFRDAFIMLYPRDIVSGDFYWFDKVGDDTFILVCADSTGHGVPGAFMSMIGSTLLQDIVSRQQISRPSEILTMLDKQIFATLNQNLEVGVSNDGMDIVVCEFTMKNRHIRFASAMRPVLLVMGGETYYIKGNRASVGGQTISEKYFDDQEYYLNEGDIIYMFSDGLPDQFGGPDGKKMKVARLKKYIDEISGLPIDQQEIKLNNFLNDWRGNYEQVDDILFMGVRV